MAPGPKLTVFVLMRENSDFEPNPLLRVLGVISRGLNSRRQGPNESYLTTP